MSTMTNLVAVGRAIAAGSKRSFVAGSRKEFSALVSLDYEFPNLPATKPAPAKASSISVSTLPNGLTVISEDASSTSTVSLTFPKAGSANEAINEQGAALINKCLCLKSGSGMSTIFINRMIENEGGTPFVQGGRHGVTVGFSVAPEKAVGLVGYLATDCSFEKWDVRDARKFAGVEIEEASHSAQIVLTENLYAAAYGPQSPAGRPFYSPPTLGLDALVAFRSRAYGMNGAILAATGITDHSSFCTEVGQILSGASVGSPEKPASITYLGGESRVSAPAAGFAHVALAFQGPSKSVVGNVVKHLFSLVGKESGVSGFSTTGLTGVYAGSANPGSLIDAMTKTVTSSVTPDLVKRAKGLAKAEHLFTLDGGSKALAELMTSAVMETGCSYTGPADVVKAYDKVTEKDVNDALTAMLKSNPALSAVGDISLVPYHATVASRFK